MSGLSETPLPSPFILFIDEQKLGLAPTAPDPDAEAAGERPPMVDEGSARGALLLHEEGSYA